MRLLEILFVTIRLETILLEANCCCFVDLFNQKRWKIKKKNKKVIFIFVHVHETFLGGSWIVKTSFSEKEKK